MVWQGELFYVTLRCLLGLFDLGQIVPPAFPASLLTTPFCKMIPCYWKLSHDTWDISRMTRRSRDPVNYVTFPSRPVHEAGGTNTRWTFRRGLRLPWLLFIRFKVKSLSRAFDVIWAPFDHRILYIRDSDLCSDKSCNALSQHRRLI